MEHPNVRTIPGQLLRQFLIGVGTPFATLIDFDGFAADVARFVGTSQDRIYTPLITLALFLRQVVDADHSCLAAVEHLAAARAAANLSPCSPDTGAYCKARQRLPLALFKDLVRRTGGKFQGRTANVPRFHGRHVKIVDGTGCSMPDTPANRREFGLPPLQKVAVGFPMARVLLVVGLASGTVLDAVVGPCRGKKTGESAALRTLHSGLESGDILLGDSIYGSYLDIALLHAAGVDPIFGMHAHRAVDFSQGLRLGADDHVVIWLKPKRPEWMTQEDYDALPATMAIRELRLQVVKAGFRTRVVVIATTLLDPKTFSKEDLMGLSRMRWQVELDIRSLKQSLAMDILRCKLPEMVHKEIWAHLLVYNLTRGAMAAAANEAGLEPRQLSFQGARQTLAAFAGRLGGATDETFGAFVGMILKRLALHRVGDRPDRFEPRERKRRPKPSKYMRYSRNESRRRAALTN
jgi:Transposase DDE domain